MSEDIKEHDIWLSPHDIDHLNDGAPVFKGIDDDVRLVLRTASWDELEKMHD